MLGFLVQSVRCFEIGFHMIPKIDRLRAGMKEHRTRVLEQYCSVLFCSAEHRTEQNTKIIFGAEHRTEHEHHIWTRTEQNRIQKSF